MRPVSFPVAIHYDDKDWVVTFASTREELRPLGEPGFIEEDSLRTAGGREFNWAFESASGLRFSLRWSEAMEYSVVVADPPEPSESALPSSPSGRRRARTPDERSSPRFAPWA